MSAAAAKPSTSPFARAERANIDAALAWSIAARPAARAQHRQRVRLGVGRARRQPRRRNGSWPPSTPPATPPRPATGPTPCCSRHGSKRRPVDLELARDHIAAATELADAIDDVDLQARCCYYLAYVVSHDGEFRQAMELTDRSRALYAGLDRPWDQAANWLFAARAAISAGDEERSVEAVDQVEHWLRAVDDPWLHVRRDAMLGELARIQHRFDDAVVHIGRAAETSRRLGFLQTEAYQLASLGRAQCQAGDYDAGACHPGARDRQGRGHRRRPHGGARPGPSRARPARARPVDRARTALEAAAAWHRAAGGGEQAAAR